jgi:hypothetical protein
MAMPIPFNAGALPPMQSEYVAWIDVMGTQSSMSRSINATANFIFKLHIAALQASGPNVRLYPVMDGFYVACPDRNVMLDFLRGVFRTVADEFNGETEPHHRFCIRGGLAFGPVIHGRDCGHCAPDLQNNVAHRDKILLGMPMVQAHLAERSAPPFAVFVHESARVFAPNGVEPLHWVWWKWGTGNAQVTWTTLKVNLPAHLEWCANRSQTIEYSPERIETHKSMVKQYFEA